MIDVTIVEMARRTNLINLVGSTLNYDANRQPNGQGLARSAEVRTAYTSDRTPSSVGNAIPTLATRLSICAGCTG